MQTRKTPPRPPGTAAAGETELRSLVRGIRILDLLERLPGDEARIEEVVAELQVPASTAYRLLRVLRGHGLVEAGSARGSFRLGRRLRSLGERAQGQDPVLRARPALEQLARETRETVFLTLRRGDEVLYADVIDSPEDLRVSPPRGRRLHVAGGASGKAILAFAAPRDIARVLARPIPAYTPDTVVDPLAIAAELAEIRRVGYAVSSNQTTPGLTGVCMPIRVADGSVLGALTVSGPALRMTAAKVALCIAALSRAVDSIVQD
jgi:IclR family acetate operon transcriptional repressor